MKIGPKELKDIAEKLSKQDLEHILLTNYPDAKIFVVRGRDMWDYKYYIKDSYFDEDMAKRQVQSLEDENAQNLKEMPNLLLDTYDIFVETPRAIHENKKFGLAYRMMIYTYLNKFIKDKDGKLEYFFSKVKRGEEK